MPTVVLSVPPTTTVEKPPVATAAPITLKMRACELEVGRPKYQVITSQVAAPTSATATVVSVTTFASTIPCPTVTATAVPESAPAKFKAPAIKTAAPGVNTRVATTVAIAFAASWKPFKNSKTSPKSTTK